MKDIMSIKTKQILTGILFTLAVSSMVNATETPVNKPSLKNHVYFQDTVVIEKAMLQQSKTIIKLYPNPSSNGTVHVSNNNAEVKELQFYIFDLEGTMIQNIRLNGMERKTVTGLNKGIYVYEVFKNDESVERGKIIVK